MPSDERDELLDKWGVMITRACPGRSERGATCFPGAGLGVSAVLGDLRRLQLHPLRDQYAVERAPVDRRSAGE